MREVTEPSIELLLSASKHTLQDALMVRLSEASNREKALTELLNLLTEKRAEIELIRWFLVHGDALMAAVTSSPAVTNSQTERLSDKPGPISSSDFRETLRNLLESA